MSEPRTAAGRALHRDFTDMGMPANASAILTIEQEAAALDVEAERVYVTNYIEQRDAALREALVARVGDIVGRQAAIDVVDAAWRAAIAREYEKLRTPGGLLMPDRPFPDSGDIPDAGNARFADPPRLVHITGTWYAIDDLDRAWEDAESALPEGMTFSLSRAVRPASEKAAPTYYATASRPWAPAAVEFQVSGATPIAALRAIAEKLRTPEGEG